MTLDYNQLDPDGDVVLILERQYDNEGVEDVLADGKGSAPKKSSKPIKPTAAEEIPATEDTLIDDAEHIRMRVSSKHLILASSYFRKMLRGGFKEAEELCAKGTVQIRLMDDHPAAMLILLNIIHGHTRRVPRVVGFRMLTQIAVLVDKYQFHEVAEAFTDSWVANLKGGTPQTSLDDLRAAICIYWVFRKPSDFKSVTYTAQMESDARMEANGLPIPASIIDKIDKGRWRGFQGYFSTLQGLLEEYQGPKVKCRNGKFECDAMTLGGLILGLKSIGCFPIPDSPYKNLCLKDMSQKLGGMSLPTLCDMRGDSYYYGTKCGIKPRIAALISSVQIAGLDLNRC